MSCDTPKVFSGNSLAGLADDRGHAWVAVPIHCPNCGVDHLHAVVYVDAEAGDRYEVIADGDVPDTVVVLHNSLGEVKDPAEAGLSCCACGWTADRFIRWAE